MIKRICSLLCIFLLLFSMPGCKSDSEDFELGGNLNRQEEPKEAPKEEKTEDQQQELLAEKEAVNKTEDPPSSQEEPEMPDSALPKLDDEQQQQPPSTSSESENEEPKIQNLFVEVDATADTAVFADGISGYQKDIYLSAAISVEEGDQITYGPASAAVRVHGFSFSTGKTTEVINATTAKEEAVYESGMRIYTYTVPIGVTHLQFNISAELKDTFMLTKNHIFTTVDSETDIDPLTGKTALFVGDSICAGSRDTAKKGAWAGRIAEETGLIATNNAVSGTSLSDTRKNRFGLVHDQLLKSKEQNFDYVVLHGGVNDAWDSIPVGKISKGFTLRSFDTTTFAGGLERLIYTALTTYGNTAAIGYLINFKAPRCQKGTVSDMSEYATVAKEICDKWGIACFDMYNHEQLTEELIYHTNIYTTDFIHPNSEGYDVLSPYIADFMRTMTPCSQEILAKVLG